MKRIGSDHILNRGQVDYLHFAGLMRILPYSKHLIYVFCNGIIWKWLYYSLQCSEQRNPCGAVIRAGFDLSTILKKKTSLANNITFYEVFVTALKGREDRFSQCKRKNGKKSQKTQTIFETCLPQFDFHNGMTFM